MRVGTIISLGASAVLGVGALVVAKVWLPSVSQSQQAKSAAPAEATVPVVVANAAIPYGGKLDASHLMLARLPASVAPQGAFTTIEQVTAYTKAGGGCLTCFDALEGVLARVNADMVAEGILEPAKAYRLGSAWAVQFHPEVEPALFAGWLARNPGICEPSGIDGQWFLGEIAAGSERDGPVLERLLHAFLDVAAARG